LNRRTGTALLYISHDLVSVLQLCDRLAVLDSGVIAECVQVAQIGQAQHPATLSLLHSLPVPVRDLLSHFSSKSSEPGPGEGSRAWAPGVVAQEPMEETPAVTTV
jgi:ABC-type dipeptide/oligopeptide/nickel transport system ATPase component